MGDYYDVSQTTGKPMKEPVPLMENGGRMELPWAPLMNYSPRAHRGGGRTWSAPARYDERNLCIAIDPSYGGGGGIPPHWRRRSAMPRATTRGGIRTLTAGTTSWTRRASAICLPPVRCGVQVSPDWGAVPAV